MAALQVRHPDDYAAHALRIKGGLIYLDPTPGGVDNLVIEYISRNWVTMSGVPIGQFIYGGTHRSA